LALRAVRSRVENEVALKRMEEIREIIERIDLRWDHGFISQEEYVEKRGQLQREVEALRPIDYDEMNEAADLIQYFGNYWDGCEEMDNPMEARQQLVQKIVDQVFVYNDQVIAVALHGNFSVVLDSGEDEMPNELAAVLKQNGCAIIFTDAQPERERRGSFDCLYTTSFGVCAAPNLKEVFRRTSQSCIGNQLRQYRGLQASRPHFFLLPFI
jgi:hypothetical protein